MSKKPASASHIAGRIRQTATLHLWKYLLLLREISLRSTLVELIGIEPMT